jgi:hypothetical protein
MHVVNLSALPNPQVPPGIVYNTPQGLATHLGRGLVSIANYVVTLAPHTRSLRIRDCIAHTLTVSHPCSAPDHLPPPPIRFPLELSTYTPQCLAAHQSSAHKHCQFCDTWFFAVDELWEHMRQAHFHCSICQTTGNPDFYLK